MKTFKNIDNQALQKIVPESQFDISAYINAIKHNIFPIFLITTISLIVAYSYALNAINIYQATSTISMKTNSGTQITSLSLNNAGPTDVDREIHNEIAIMKSTTIMESVADAIIDSFRVIGEPEKFASLVNRQKINDEGDERIILRSKKEIIKQLRYVNIFQRSGLDIIDVSYSSPSPFEAALVSNIFIEVYQKYNLDRTRRQATAIRKFIEDRRDETFTELRDAEELLRDFQEKGGFLNIDDQSSIIINKISELETAKNEYDIEKKTIEMTLASLKEELRKKSPEVSLYIESFANEEYLRTIQNEIAKQELNRDVVLAGLDPNISTTQEIENYNRQIDVLKKKLRDRINSFQETIIVSTPDELRSLTNEIIQEEIKLDIAEANYQQYDKQLQAYERKFDKLPKSSVEYARLERNLRSIEALYLMVEEKYQEALITEQSKFGNIDIIDYAQEPTTPTRPNRFLIIFIGFLLGLTIAILFALLRTYFDNTIKTPDDLQNRDINVLAWIPQIDTLIQSEKEEFDFVVSTKPDSIPAEAFRVLRTRVQLASSQLNKKNKIILITSAAPAEGKTMICTNIAGSFSQSNKKTLIIDCDFRKPRIHTFFETSRFPGLVDYLFGQVTLDEIIRETELPQLSYITAGTIPPNPAELLESPMLEKVLAELRESYDYIFIDSPPLIAVTDAEILADKVDATMLVVSANTTEINVLERAWSILLQNDINFIGAVLNNFIYRSSYGTYYKYYYYYSRPKKAKTGTYVADKQNVPKT
jgi:tyrosine-protein kinase Etk/Wzc